MNKCSDYYTLAKILKDKENKIKLNKILGFKILDRDHENLAKFSKLNKFLIN